MRDTRRFGRVVRVALVVALVAGALLAGGAADAQQPRRGLFAECRSTARVEIERAGPRWIWEIDAVGVCSGPSGGPYIAISRGQGTSDSLGLCDGLVVRNLRLFVRHQLLSAQNPQNNRVLNELWTGVGFPQANVTTFPLVTPFEIWSEDGNIALGISGAGAIFHRFGLRCPPNDRPGATIYHVRILFDLLPR